MNARRGARDSGPPSPNGSDEDEARSPTSGDEAKSPTLSTNSAVERGRKVSRKGLTVLNDELKRDPLDIVH